MISTRIPLEASDTVSSIVSLLVRFPQISSIWSHPTDRTIRLTYAVARRLTTAEQRVLAAEFDDHVRGFVEVEGRGLRILRLRCEADEGFTFLHVTRDSASFTREELLLQIGLLSQRFGDTLVTNPASDDVGEDALSADEAVERAIDSMRDPAQKKSLVGYREEKRVLVYFLKSRKAKASARR